jgi:hypothetical protein
MEDLPAAACGTRRPGCRFCNATIRAARRLGRLSDEDAEAAMKISRDRNLAVNMYRGQIGAEMDERLGAHAALLWRWLGALRRLAADVNR